MAERQLHRDAKGRPHGKRAFERKPESSEAPWGRGVQGEEAAMAKAQRQEPLRESAYQQDLSAMPAQRRSGKHPSRGQRPAFTVTERRLWAEEGWEPTCAKGGRVGGTLCSVTRAQRATAALGRGSGTFPRRAPRSRWAGVQARDTRVRTGVRACLVEEKERKRMIAKNNTRYLLRTQDMQERLG